MSLALYPYVYLTARTAFQEQGRQLLEAAQSLGLSRRQAFWRVALPIARPAIVAGVSLALMETLADFGTVAVFNYDTFTSAIYKTWFSLFSLTAASQLAAFLVLFVLTLVWLEQSSRSAYPHSPGHRTPLRLHLRPRTAWLATGYASLVFSLAFVLPLLQLLVWAWRAAAHDLDSRYFGFIWHTLLLAGSGALTVTLFALALAYAQHRQPTRLLRFGVRLATLGYALPGAVLAVGFFIPLAWLDNQILALRHSLGDPSSYYWLQGTLAIMLLAYVARFLAVAFGPIETGFGRITRHLDEAAQSLGVTGLARLRRVHLPLLRSSILTALALTFVDIMKELPITLMTRPFGWDTLAVRVFEMTSEGEWERAALPATAIVLVGLIPVFLLARQKHARS
jgi:iron(III) transport system permease protein